MTGIETHRVTLSVNGRRVEVTVEPRDTLADVLRDRCGLTGVKLGCEQGSCGACTVVHDGRQIRSCLLFAVQAADADVWTIEGLSRPDDQRAADGPLPELPELAGALKQNHGLQCGFCTPGMLIAGTALGQAADGDLGEREIREGLSGNICRCTGYQGIVRSIAETIGRVGVAGEQPVAGSRRGETDHDHDPEHEHRHLASVLRVEDDGLLDGSRLFIDDLEPRGTLHLAMVRSTVAHGRIHSLDTAGASAMPGVHAVLTGDDLAAHTTPTPIGWEHIPGQRQTGSLAMATDKVRYVGHIVAAVVADSRARAEDAAEMVEVDYDELPAVMDVDAARHDDAPLLHETWPDNVLAVDEHSSGQGRAALQAAATVVEVDLAIGRAFGCPLETRGVIADWSLAAADNGARSGSVGRLVVDINSQSPNRVREMLAQVLGVSVSDVLIRVPAIGGGFGSKANYYGEEIIACVASKLSGHPVKYIEDRYESFVATSHARQANMSVSIGADDDGTIVAYRNDLVGTLGGEVSSVGMGPVWVSTRAGIGSYVVPNADITTTGVMTNRTPFGSFRGWGSPIANFGIERAMDALADELGVDPVELRLQNMVQPDQMPFANGLGWRLDSGDYPAALRRARTSITSAGWYDEAASARAEGRIVGVGLANFIEATGVGNSRKMGALPMEQGGFDEAVVRMDSTGAVQVFTGQTAMGQGIETTLAQICADELGAAVSDVRVLFGDTDSCPYTGYGTGGCRSAPVAGSSVLLASRDLRTQVLDMASSLLEVPVAELTVGESIVSGPSGAGVGFAEIGRAAYRKLNHLPDHHSPTLHARAVWDPVDRTIGYGSVAVMVEVDADTGITSVLRYHAVDDCGRVINPAIVDGQIMGAFVQVLGSSLMEELRYDADGNPVTTTFRDYLVPLAGDVPPMTVEHLETLPLDVPSGSKGVGEAGTIAAMSAIAQAVEDAVGGGYGWVRSIPVDPEDLLGRISASHSPDES